jgi:hypothetical protein
MFSKFGSGGEDSQNDDRIRPGIKEKGDGDD